MLIFAVDSRSVNQSLRGGAGMNVRRSLIGLITAAGVLGWCGVASATYNRYGLTPNWLADGTLILGLWATATLLFGFIERPFYSAAGVERDALARSIQINLLSSIVFGLLIVIPFELILALFPISILILVTAVAGLEYLLLNEAERRQISFAPLWVGNAASMATFVAIAFASRLPIGKFLVRYVSADENHYAYAGMAVTAAWVVGTTISLLRRKPDAEPKTKKISIGLPPAEQPGGDDNTDAA
jgi:hypothetical protein